jgi:hypothetical protein
MANQPRGSSKVYRSKFALASAPGYWNASFTADTAEPYIEMDLSVTLQGAPVARFWPYAIKVSGASISFDFMDYEKPVFVGPGDQIELTCTLFYTP